MSGTVTARDTAALPAKTRSRFSLKRSALAFATVAALAGGAWYGNDWWRTGRFIESTDDAYVGGNVTTISAHVPGYIDAILAGDNQHVKAGQVIVRLDQRDYQAAVDRARATLDARRAALESLRAQYDQQQAIIQQQEADVAAKASQAVFAEQDASRYRDLARTAAGSRQDAERTAALNQQARSVVMGAGAALQAAKQRLAVLHADIAEAEATLVSADADLRTAQLNLEWTEIRAPIDGIVGNRLAQVGAYATAGSYVISVIPSAGLWVDANFKEDQLTHMVPGQSADVVADVLPGHVFHAHVVSLAPGTGGVFSVIPPENATGNFTKIVQRVPVRVQLDGDDALLDILRPGLSTTVAVDTKAVDVKAVDNKALDNKSGKDKHS